MNRVTVKIAGKEYTLLAEETKEYMDEVARLVDEQVSAAHRNSNLTIEQASVLAAVNMADEYLKAVKQADAMRSQLQSYIEENNRLRSQQNRNSNKRR